MNQSIKESSQNQPATAGQNVQDEPTAESGSAPAAEAGREQQACGGSAPSLCSASGASDTQDYFDLDLEQDPSFIGGGTILISSLDDFRSFETLISRSLTKNPGHPIHFDFSIYRGKKN